MPDFPGYLRFTSQGATIYLPLTHFAYFLVGGGEGQPITVMTFSSGGLEASESIEDLIARLDEAQVGPE